MAKKISELNKKERDLRNTLENLKREYRKNQISKNDYNNAIKDKQSNLEKINNEKKKLIGKLPPIPIAPVKPSPLLMIKNEVSTEKPAIEAAKTDNQEKEEKTEEKPRQHETEEKKETIKAQNREHRKIVGSETGVKKESSKKPTEKPRPSNGKVLIKKMKPEAKKLTVKKTKTINVKKVTDKPSNADKSISSVDDSRVMISTSLKKLSNETDVDIIKQVFRETQKEFLTFLLDVKKNREKIHKLESLFSEVNDIRKKFGAMDFKGMTDEIYKQFERMNSLIKENETKIEKLVNSNETKIGTLEKRMNELSASVDKIPVVDSVKKDMETVKQKIEWIENNTKEADMQPVMDMVSDVEKKLDVLKLKSPYIIE